MKPSAFLLFGFMLFWLPVLYATQHDNDTTTILHSATVSHIVQHNLKATNGDKESSLDISKIIFGHIQDAHDFHFFTYGDFHATIPLPIIIYTEGVWSIFMSSKFEHGHASYKGFKLINEKITAVDSHDNILPNVKIYDISLTKNVVQMLIAMALFVLLLFKATNMYASSHGSKIGDKKIRGVQSWLEPVIIFIRDEVAIANMGNKGTKFAPFLLSIFFFILVNNLFGLIPGAANVTGNIAFTLALSVLAFIVILVSTNRHFWSHIFWPQGPILIKFILIPIEFVGIFTKPFALMIRLFANMVAGHIIIVCFISLIFIFGKLSVAVGIGFSPVSVLFTVFIYGIELLVAFIQAFIFTNLTAVFIGLSQGGDDHHDNENQKH